MKNEIKYLLAFCILLFYACKDLEKISFITVTTNKASEIGITSFTISGALTGLVEKDGIADHGFVYSSTDSVPDLSNITDGKFSIGSINTNRAFEATITDLTINSTYYVRAFVQKEGETPILSDDIVLVSLNEIDIRFSEIAIEKGVGEVILRNTIEGLAGIPTIDNYGHVWSNENKMPTLENGSANFSGTLQANSVDVESKIDVAQLVALDTYYARTFIVSGTTVFYSDNVVEFVKGDVWQLYSTNFNRIFSPYVEFTFELSGEIYVYKSKNEFGKYNFSTNEWINLVPFPENISHPITFTLGDKGYVAINRTDEAATDFWEFDPEEDIQGKWTPRKRFPGTVQKDAFSFSIEEKGYIGLGFKNGDFDDIELWEYTPPKEGTEDVWQKAPNSTNFKIGRIDNITYFSFEDKGCIKVEFPFIECYCYQPSIGWQEAPSFPFNISGSFNHRFFTIGNSGFIIIGDDTNNFWEFDAQFILETGQKGKWIPRIDFPAGFDDRGNPFSVNNKGYIGIGRSKDQLWQYIPTSN